MAPLLLVIAVLAGTCAPDVFAMGKNLVVSNGCHKPLKIVIEFKGHLPYQSLHVEPGKDASLGSPVLVKLVDSIQFTIYEKEYRIYSSDFYYLAGKLGFFTKIAILCDAPKPCGHAFITVKLTVDDLGKETTKTICIKKY